MDIKQYKQKQLDAILAGNPMLDDYHVGIRTIDDILTYAEAIEFEEPCYPDWTLNDAKKAINDGYITIYSSYPIQNGTFISPSKAMAWEYAGGQIALPKSGGIQYLGQTKLYSKQVPLDNVAWINGDEGQYAEVNLTEHKNPKKIIITEEQFKALKHLW